MMQVDTFMKLNGSKFWRLSLSLDEDDLEEATANDSFYGVSQYAIQVAYNCYKYETPEGWYPRHRYFDRYERFEFKDRWKSEKRRRLEKEIIEIIKEAKLKNHERRFFT